MLPKQTLQETVGRFLASCDEDRPGPVPTPPLQPRKNLPSSNIPDGPVGVVNAPEVQSISKVQQEVKKQHDEAVRLIVSGLKRIKMPKREFPSFNGDQKRYPCPRGVDKVVKGPQNRTWESKKLSQLAHDTKSCALNSDHMHYKADINSMDMLKRIVMQLPPHLQAKWAEESNKLIEAEREPEFSHLAGFVERRVTVTNTTFGKLKGARLEMDVKPKFRQRPGGNPGSRERITLSRQRTMPIKRRGAVLSGPRGGGGPTFLGVFRGCSEFLLIKRADHH